MADTNVLINQDTVESRPLVQRSDRKKKTVSLWTLFAINFYWFPLYYHSTFISNIVAPAQVLSFANAENNKGLGLGVVWTVAAIAGMFAAPLVGILSDRTTARLGRRRPWILFGVISNFMLGFALSFSPSLLVYSLVMAADVITITCVFSPLASLIPDLVPKEQSGRASGVQQALLTLGGLGACIMGYFNKQIGTIPHAFMFYSYLIEMVFMISGIPLLLFFVPEVPIQVPIKKEKETLSVQFKGFLQTLKPFWNRDFVLLCLVVSLSQGLVNTIATQFYQYYVVDILKPPFSLFGYLTVEGPAAAGSVYTIALLLGSAVASYPAGEFSDRIGRRLILVLALLFQMAAPLGLAFTRTFEYDLIFGALFGIGNVALNAVAFATLNDLMPYLNRGLKDKNSSHNGLVNGVFNVAQTLPSLFGPALNGQIIDHYDQIKQPETGYHILFGLCLTYLVIGIILSLPIRSSERRRKDLGASLTFGSSNISASINNVDENDEDDEVIDDLS